MRSYAFRCILLLGVVMFSMGCSPAMLSFLVMPWVDNKAPAACKLADPDKEVTVAIVARFSETPNHPDLWTADAEIADYLLLELNKNCKENKEKIKFIANTRVKSYLTKPINGTASLQEIGKQLKADKVIDLEINSLSLLMPNSPGLYQGRANIDVKLVEVDPKSGGDPAVFSKVFTLTFPRDRPEDANDLSAKQFRSKVSARIARDIGRYFTAWEMQHREMD